MARKKVKLSDGTNKDEEDDEPKTMAVDRLSELPDAVIHIILSLIPTADAVRMSVLSKRWRNMWCSLPALTFDDSDFNAKMFSKLVAKCLKLRKDDMLTANGESAITKFKLATASMWRWSSINSWLHFVSKSKIEELDLYVISRSRSCFCLPPNILRLESLTRLRLASVEVQNLYSNLPSLILLSLEDVKLSDQVLCNLLLGCCSLERLLLKSCRGLWNLKVSSSRLKSLEIDSTECDAFQVQAMNLQSFVCSGRQTRIDILSLLLCEALRNLSFTSSRLDAQCLEDQILGLPVLESLNIRDCDELESVRINHRHLKYLSFEGNGVSGGAVVKIDCPKLVFFSYEGFLMPNSSIVPGENLLEAKIKCHNPAAYDTAWYKHLIDFLQNLNCPNTMLLDVFSEEALIVPRKLRKHIGSPLPALKHLKVRTSTPSSGNYNLRDAINWLSPSLESLSIE